MNFYFKESSGALDRVTVFSGSCLGILNEHVWDGVEHMKDYNLQQVFCLLVCLQPRKV